MPQATLLRCRDGRRVGSKRYLAQERALDVTHRFRTLFYFRLEGLSRLSVKTCLMPNLEAWSAQLKSKITTLL